MLASIFPWLVRIDVTLEPHEVNGQPGAIFRDRDGKVLYTLALDVLDGQIQTIRSVSNPDKLGHVGPVADAWAVAREVNQARRPTGLTGRADRAQDSPRLTVPRAKHPDLRDRDSDSPGGFTVMSAMTGSGMPRRRSSAASRALATWSSL